MKKGFSSDMVQNSHLLAHWSGVAASSLSFAVTYRPVVKPVATRSALYEAMRHLRSL
jgi:hypothetical protein